MASTTWRMIGIDTQGADLVLTQIQPWSANGAVVPVGIQSSIAPKSGALTDLLDATASAVTFSAEDVWAPGFEITLTFSDPVDLWGFRFAGPSATTWPKRHVIAAGNIACQRNRVLWVSGGLSPAPTVPPNFVTPTGIWTAQTTLGSKNWRSASVSSDGQIMLAGGSGDYPWLSKDGGATWAAVTAVGSGDWTVTLVSGDGQTLLAGSYGGALWLSQDGGSTWVAQSSLGLAGWSCAAASSDGAVLMCGIFGGAFWLTKDGGVTWVVQTPLGNNSWRSASVSSDGQTILVGGTGRPQLSKDGGVTWAPVTAVGSGDWAATTVSGDGQVMLAGSYGGSLWLSTDAGLTWVAQVIFGNNVNWWRGACSSDGRTLLCSVFGGGVYLSKDSGATWIKQTVLPDAEWRAAALSSNGLVMLAGASAATVRLRIDEDPIYLSNALTCKLSRALTVPSATQPPVQGLQTIFSQRIAKLVDVEFGGQARLYGTVTRKGTPANAPLRRRVRLHRSIDGYLVSETWSKADGSYEFTEISGRYEYDVIAWDHERQDFSTVANNQLAEVMP